MESRPSLHLLSLCAPKATQEEKRKADDAGENSEPKCQKKAERLRFGIYVASKGGVAREAIENMYWYNMEIGYDLPTKGRIIRTLEGNDSEDDQLFCDYSSYMLRGIRQMPASDHFVCAFDTTDYVGGLFTQGGISLPHAPKLVGMITISAGMSPEEWSNAALSLLDDPNSIAFLSPEDDQKLHCQQLLNRMSFELKYVCTNNGQGYSPGCPEYIPGILRGMVRAVERMVFEYWVEKAFEDYLVKMTEQDPDYENYDTIERLLGLTVLTLKSVNDAVQSYQRVGFKATNEETGRMFKFGYDFHDHCK